jgi:diacylglycerol kinase
MSEEVCPETPEARMASPSPKSVTRGPTASALQNPEGPASPKPRRRWRDKFREAIRGLKLGIRGHSSFFVHFFFAALVVAAAIVLRCEPYEWCLLLGCIGMVLTAELFNNAVETIYWGLDERTKPRVRHSLDIGAGAVLMASIAAVIVGGIIFLPKLAALLAYLFAG